MPGVKRRIQRIKHVLISEQTHIVETAFILMLPALLTKITGQFFNLIAASYFGADSLSFNLFLVANAIPELIATVLMVGTLGTIIIPVLMACKDEEGDKKFHEMYSSIFNVTMIAFSIISIFLMIFASKLIPLALKISDPTSPPTDQEITTIANMMRVLLLPQLVLGISVFITSGLRIYNRIVLSQLSPLVYNVGRIFTLLIFVLVLVPRFPNIEDNIHWALVIGTVIGSFLHLAIQIPLFMSLDFEYYPKIDIRSPYLKEVLLLGLPRLFVLASDQIGIAVNRFLAYAFVGGASAFYFAFSLYLVIPALFGYTFSDASYPTVTKMFIEKDFNSIRYITSKTLNQIFFLSLPFVVTIMVLRVPIVRLVYGIMPGTNFNFDDSYQVAWILLWFSFGLVFITARWFVFSLFYASRDTLLPFLISIFSLISVISLSILFTNWFSHNPGYAISTIPFDNISNFFNRSTSRAGVGGIALAMSVTYTIEFFILILVFNFKKVNLDLHKLADQIGRKILAAVGMFIFMYFIYKTWNSISYTLPDTASEYYRGSTTFNLFLLTTTTVIPGFLIYYSLCLLLKVKDLKLLKRYLNPLFQLGGVGIKD